MRSLFRLHHLTWFLAVAVMAVAVACDDSNVKSPTAATPTAVGSDTTAGPGAPTEPVSTPGSSTTPGSPTTPGSGTPPGPGTPPGSGTESTPGPGRTNAQGTLTVNIKDSPFSEASALLVTFSEVRVHVADDEDDDSIQGDADEGEWLLLPFAGGATTRTCDLKRLVAATDVLGTAPLQAGHYTQIRLTVSGARIYKTATTTGAVCSPTPALAPATDLGQAVEISSGTLKLNRQFTVPAGGATTILLDFDGDKSITKTGNDKYKMKPVITVVSVQ